MDTNPPLQAEKPLEGLSLIAWKTVQIVVFALGLGLVASLWWMPTIGIHALWNVLIPIAPLLLALAPGLWRNICPMAFAALLPRKVGISGRRRMALPTQGIVQFAAVVLLFLIVPFRHLIFDTNGPAAALLLIGGTIVAVTGGLLFEWKSAWCSGLCPVSPVEKLYGEKVAHALPNAHCTMCRNCVTPCPDSTPNMHPFFNGKTGAHRKAAFLLTGGLPGFIWGWFHVSDLQGPLTAPYLLTAFAYPYLPMAITLLAFYGLTRYLAPRHFSAVVRSFAAAAIICYYWFRLPMLIGFGHFPPDGMLVDLSGQVPVWLPTLLQVGAATFFLWWFFRDAEKPLSWSVRPPFEKVSKKYPKNLQG